MPYIKTKKPFVLFEILSVYILYMLKGQLHWVNCKPGNKSERFYWVFCLVINIYILKDCLNDAFGFTITRIYFKVVLEESEFIY